MVAHWDSSHLQVTTELGPEYIRTGTLICSLPYLDPLMNTNLVKNTCLMTEINERDSKF